MIMTKISEKFFQIIKKRTLRGIPTKLFLLSYKNMELAGSLIMFGNNPRGI